MNQKKKMEWYPTSYLEHHGIKGQKWGVRRFQNADGSLTNAGRRRLENMKRDSRLYGEGIAKLERLNRSIGLESGQKLDHQTVVPKDFLKTYRHRVEHLQKIEQNLAKRKYNDIKANTKLMDDGHEYVVTYLTDHNIGTYELYTLIK